MKKRQAKKNFKKNNWKMVLRQCEIISKLLDEYDLLCSELDIAYGNSKSDNAQ